MSRASSSRCDAAACPFAAPGATDPRLRRIGTLMACTEINLRWAKRDPADARLRKAAGCRLSGRSSADREHHWLRQRPQPRWQADGAIRSRPKAAQAALISNPDSAPRRDVHRRLHQGIQRRGRRLRPECKLDDVNPVLGVAPWRDACNRCAPCSCRRPVSRALRGVRERSSE